MDVTGRKIKTLFHNEPISKQQTIIVNLENMDAGIYFLNIIGSNNTKLTKKIIKQ